MYNLPETDDSRHPKEEGEWLHPSNLGERKVYLSEIPKIFPEMRALTGIDVAFVCNESPIHHGM